MFKEQTTITNETTRAVDLHSCGEGTGANIGFFVLYRLLTMIKQFLMLNPLSNTQKKDCVSLIILFIERFDSEILSKTACEKGA